MYPRSFQNETKINGNEQTRNLWRIRIERKQIRTDAMRDTKNM